MTLGHSTTTNSVLFLAFAISIHAHATWSIVAVDPEAHEVGLAAATCSPGIQFTARSVPGAGVVVAQAATSFKGRNQARDWIAEGVGAEEILRRLSNPAFYDGWFGGKSGGTYSVQGNTLRGQTVITDAARAFEQREDGSCRLTLGERLLRGLEAGRNAGGDKRCPPDKPALSAILITERFSADGDEEEGLADSLRLVAPQEISLLRAAYYIFVPYRPDENATEPVKLLRERFEAAGASSCR